MKTSELDYNLPEKLIAKYPAEPRDSAKLLILNREDESLADYVFSDLANLLFDTDVLVLNNSKVIPARIYGKVGEREHEVLLVKQLDTSIWECWVKGGRKLHKGDTLKFSDNLSAEFVERQDEIFILRFNLSGGDLLKSLVRIGEMPIPPYIVKARAIEARNSKLEISLSNDDSEYQTVYAKNEGSVAAPTAGLHFTNELLSKLHDKGVQLEYVTLHVGLGTFQPINTESVEDFKIHSEYYEIDPDTATRLNEAKLAGKRIIAVGTTTVRVLESAATKIDSCGKANCRQISQLLLPRSGETSIYIYPGYKYKFVDAMITNFHLPKSSLLLLVSAFAGTGNINKAYKYSIDHNYRFYSYGDAMLIE